MKSSILKQGRLSALFSGAVLALAISSAAQAGDMSQQEMDRMDANCALAATKKSLTVGEAARCVVPFYKAAIDKSDEIKQKVLDAGIHDRYIDKWMNTFDATCTMDKNKSFTGHVESHLWQPERCLSVISGIAQQYKVDHDHEGAGFLISRLRRLRHLEVAP